MYLTNESTGQTVEFGIFGAGAPGWRPSTQEEIDAYLLSEAKSAKVQELLSEREAFLVAGYEYQGAIVCPAWDGETTYNIDALVQGSDAKNYHSLVADNLNHDPVSSPEYWEEFFPAFKMDDVTVLNIDSKCKLESTAVNRYKFYCKCEVDGHRHQINFGDSEKWSVFVKSFLSEQDRVMRKYNDYRNQIAACATVAEVEAVVIDFNA